MEELAFGKLWTNNFIQLKKEARKRKEKLISYLEMENLKNVWEHNSLQQWKNTLAERNGTKNV